jgi:hypothetical protein
MQECIQMFIDRLLIGHWVEPGLGEFGGVRAQKF